MHFGKCILWTATLSLVSMAALADAMPSNAPQDISVAIYATSAAGKGAFMGSVVMEQTPFGVVIAPQLKNLTPGLHGFHLHDMPTCGAMGMDAAGHYDPNNTGKHLGPYRADGHLGDLPALYVDNDGRATLPTLAPRLKLTDFYGHALMIHSGGDNYSDYPRDLGGGGPRVACGVVQKLSAS